jgi:S-adenosylmethionine:diacylglycerol 3-amino-3-carboxypropyl transferase
MTLPPTRFNFATSNEDASVERLLLEELGPDSKKPLRVACVAACGSMPLTLCASPDVQHVDAIDVAPAQLRLAALQAAAVLVLESAEQLAVFIGNLGESAERESMYARVKAELSPPDRDYWNANVETIRRGIIYCGGAERCYATTRENLPSPEFEVLAADPDGVLNALRAGISMETQRENMMIPEEAMRNIAEHGVPVIAAQLSARLGEIAGGDPDFIVELILRGRFAMDPNSSRPLYLRTEIFDEMRQNGCGADRLSFHEGPLEAVAATRAHAQGPYDLIDMSNILDMSAPEAAAQSVKAIAGAARPGGVLVCRSHKPPGFLEPLFAECGLKVDTELSRRAREAETSFFMNDVCVAYG